MSLLMIQPCYNTPALLIIENSNNQFKAILSTFYETMNETDKTVPGKHTPQPQLKQVPEGMWPIALAKEQKSSPIWLGQVIESW